MDNSLLPGFPPLAAQADESCSALAGVSVTLSHEWNRLAKTNDVHLTGRFAWHLLNGGQNRGIELAEAWQIARDWGAPSAASYSEPSTLGGWMDGYERYLDAMRHRAASFEFLPLNTLADLENARKWLRQGGVLAVEARFEGRTEVPLADETKGKLITAWGKTGRGHVMTIIGYDDSLGHDLSGDGEITNGRDLEGDGKVGLSDSERGAFLLATSHGKDWTDGGKAHVLYRASATSDFRRGRWVARVRPRVGYSPALTLRLSLFSSDASALRLSVSSRDARGRPREFHPLLFSPEKVLAVRQWQSPERYSRFARPEPRLAPAPIGSADQPIEIGLDLTDALPRDAKSLSLTLSLTSPAAELRVPSATVLACRKDGTIQRELPLHGPERLLGVGSISWRQEPAE